MIVPVWMVAKFESVGCAAACLESYYYNRPLTAPVVDFERVQGFRRRSGSRQ